MKRSFFPIASGFLLLIAAAALTCCGGTETGNPALRPPDGTPPSENPAIALMEATCGKLASCRADISDSACRSAISASTTLATELGLEDQGYPAFIDVLIGLENGELAVNAEGLRACIDSIRAFDCSDSPILEVRVDPDGTVSNLEQVIPEEGCSQVFPGR